MLTQSAFDRDRKGNQGCSWPNCTRSATRLTARRKLPKLLPFPLQWRSRQPDCWRDEKVGHDGVITIEESKGLILNSLLLKGCSLIAAIWASTWLPTTTRCSWSGWSISWYRQEDLHIQDILPLLQEIVQQGKALLIIADDVAGEALPTLVLNKIRGTFNVVAVKAPGYGDRRKAQLEDIATLTGGTVISSDLGLIWRIPRLKQLGRAGKVTVTKMTPPLLMALVPRMPLLNGLTSSRSRLPIRPATSIVKNCKNA